MAHLVRQYAPQLALVHDAQRCPVVTATAAWLGLRPVAKAFGSGRSMTYRDGHRDAGAAGEVAHDPLDLGRLARLERSGAVGLERDAVAEPVDADVEDDASCEREDEAGAAADDATDRDQQAAQRGEQGPRS